MCQEFELESLGCLWAAGADTGPHGLGVLGLILKICIFHLNIQYPVIPTSLVFWLNIWQMKLKERGFLLAYSSRGQSTMEVVVSGVWSSWSNSAHSEKAKAEECW